MSAGDYLTVAQVAARLAVSKMTVYRMLASGTLPHLAAGPRGRRVLAADVEAYVAARTVGADAPWPVRFPEPCSQYEAGFNAALDAVDDAKAWYSQVTTGSEPVGTETP